MVSSVICTNKQQLLRHSSLLFITCGSHQANLELASQGKGGLLPALAFVVSVCTSLHAFTPAIVVEAAGWRGLLRSDFSIVFVATVASTFAPTLRWPG